MTVDKRSVFTDALVTLGTIHNVAEGTRDAIHVAGRVCKAARILSPGMSVGRLPDGRYGTGEDVKLVGIVDPFLPEDAFIVPDQVFWLMIKPRTITSLQHVWQHPDFPRELTDAERMDAKVKALREACAVEEKARQEKYDDAVVWMQAFWSEVDMDSYEQLMDAADNFVETGDHLVEGERWESARGVLSEHYDEFWANYEVIRGVTLTEDQKGGIFCCSC